VWNVWTGILESLAAQIVSLFRALTFEPFIDFAAYHNHGLISINPLGKILEKRARVEAALAYAMRRRLA
jgi:hypothetical protein